MPGALSDYLENKLLDHILKTAEYSQPVNIYVALSKSDPGEDGEGLEEPSGMGYARKLHNTWGAAADGATENVGEIEFTKATGLWGTITHFALFDAETGGNMLLYGSLDAPKIIKAGTRVKFEEGELDVTAD